MMRLQGTKQNWAFSFLGKGLSALYDVTKGCLPISGRRKSERMDFSQFGCRELDSGGRRGFGSAAHELFFHSGRSRVIYFRFDRSPVERIWQTLLAVKLTVMTSGRFLHCFRPPWTRPPFLATGQNNSPFGDRRRRVSARQ